MATQPFKCEPLTPNLPPRWKSAADFNKWHDEMWTFPVDPKNFGPEVFTPDVLLEGPREADVVQGAEAAAYVFAQLFARYPNLSGKHYSFAASDKQIFIFWAFFTSKGVVEIEVPVIDLFCVRKGQVAYRFAGFDSLRLQDALNRAYPPPAEAPPEQQLGFQHLWTRWHGEGRALAKGRQP